MGSCEVLNLVLKIPASFSYLEKSDASLPFKPQLADVTNDSQPTDPKEITVKWYRGCRDQHWQC